MRYFANQLVFCGWFNCPSTILEIHGMDFFCPIPIHPFRKKDHVSYKFTPKNGWLLEEKDPFLWRGGLLHPIL